MTRLVFHRDTGLVDEKKSRSFQYYPTETSTLAQLKCSQTTSKSRGPAVKFSIAIDLHARKLPAASRWVEVITQIQENRCKTQFAPPTL